MTSEYLQWYPDSSPNIDIGLQVEQVAGSDMNNATNPRTTPVSVKVVMENGELLPERKKNTNLINA